MYLPIFIINTIWKFVKIKIVSTAHDTKKIRSFTIKKDENLKMFNIIWRQQYLFII